MPLTGCHLHTSPWLPRKGCQPVSCPLLPCLNPSLWSSLVILANSGSKETSASGTRSTWAGWCQSLGAVTTTEDPERHSHTRGKKPSHPPWHVLKLRSLWKDTWGMARTRALMEWDYLVSGALLMGLSGTESLPQGAGRPVVVVAVAAAGAAAGLPWLRPSEGTLRVLRREEKLQEHRWESGWTCNSFQLKIKHGRKWKILKNAICYLRFMSTCGKKRLISKVFKK